MSVIRVILEGDAAFSDLAGKEAQVIHLTGPFTIAALESGMKSGAPSLAIRIDLVLIPQDLWELHHEIAGLGPVRMSGNKIMRVEVGNTQVDIYFCEPETWATLLLIRTGSAENNIRLASLAKKKGWHLAASGDGLFNENGQRIAGDTEASIYKALGLPFQEPWERK